jgi:hypothetical protein
MACEARLADMAEISPGYPFRGRVPERPAGRVRVVQMRDITDEGGVDWRGAARTDLPGKRKPDWLQPGDVLFLHRGRRNLAVCLESVPGPAVSSPHFFLLRVKPKAGLLPRFLAWQMNQAPARRYFEASAEGTYQLSIRRAVLEELPVKAPDLSTQERIIRLAETAQREKALYQSLMDNREQALAAVAQDILGS